MMRPRAQLKQLKRSSQPRADFKAALKSELSAEFDVRYPALRRTWQRALAMPVALGIVVLTMGTGTYAYASPEVTDQHALYAVKRNIERVEGQLQFTPQAKARFHARMMERRLAEAEVLNRRRELMINHVQHVADELNLSIESLESVSDDPSRQELFDQLKLQTSRYELLIVDTLAEEAADPEATRESLRNTIQEIRVHLDESALTEEEKQELFQRVRPDILELREQWREQHQDDVAPEMLDESASIQVN